MYMAEDYNSPQSVYWCLKTLIAVGLSEDEDFWTAEELPCPKFTLPTQVVPAPQQILCNHPLGNHHFMLTPGQFVAWPMKASQAKYCKFAYSSSFAFSVPTGPLIQQIAPDNQLALSRDGAGTWAVKWKCEPVQFGEAVVRNGVDGDTTVPTARVKWYPWGDRAVSVDTILIPPVDRCPDWHVRVHRIRCTRHMPSLHIVEGGFAIYGRKDADGLALPNAELADDAIPGVFEGVSSEAHSTLIASRHGASGIVSQVLSSLSTTTTTSAMKPDANTNVAQQRTLIPISSCSVIGGLKEGTEIMVVSYVFAIASEANGGCGREADLKKLWLKMPKVEVDGSGKEVIVVD